MKYRFLLFCSIGILFVRTTAWTQDFKVFGFSQALLTSSAKADNNLQSIGVNAPAQTTFSLQQLNIMGSSNFGGGFSFFTNIEYLSNYNTQFNFGRMSVQEAFVRYQNDNATINVKAGQFIPRYGSFVEVYNRMPLIPYLFRPILYEPQFQSYFAPEDFVPFRANLQIYGDVPLTDQLSAEYALFEGNPETPFLAVAGSGTGGGGINSTTKMLYGGRLGVALSTNSIGSLRLGVSGVMDNDNQEVVTLGGIIPSGMFAGKKLSLGDVRRSRVGFDVMYSYGNLSLTAEYTASIENLTASQQSTMDTLFRKMTLPLAGGGVTDFSDMDLNKSFYFATAEYTIADDYTVYAELSHLEDHFLPLIMNGLDQYSFGGRWTVNPHVALKMQYHVFKMVEPNPFQLHMANSMAAVGVSVMF